MAQEMQLWQCTYCMKETWNTTMKSVCYVDYEKAFDHVDWTKLMTILQLLSGMFTNISVNFCYCEKLQSKVSKHEV